MEIETTQLKCDGHNWEIGQVHPEWTGGTVSVTTYQEIALVICTFCGIVRKTRIENLVISPQRPPSPPKGIQPYPRSYQCLKRANPSL